MRRTLVHPSWCAGGQRCQLGEHRSHPMTLEGVGLVVTLVQPYGRSPYAEIRSRYRLSGADEAAQARVLLRLLFALARVRKEMAR